MSDPTGGWASATEKASEAVTELAKAGRDVLTSSPLGPFLGSLKDTVEVWRMQRRYRLKDQAELFLRQRGLKAPSRDVAPSFLMALFDQASLEEDDDLQDIWARLLANAADASSNTEPRTAFIAMLKEMTASDVRILADISEADILSKNGVVYVGNSISNVISEVQTVLPNAVAVSIGNLARLGCINPSAAVGGALIYSQVRLTALGKAFIKACTST